MLDTQALELYFYVRISSVLGNNTPCIGKFYTLHRAMVPRNPGVDKEYIKSHFQDVIGKIYTPYDNKEYYSLALDKSDPEGNNDNLLTELGKYFFITDEIKLGQDPSEILQNMKAEGGKKSEILTSEMTSNLDERCVLTGYVGRKEANFVDFGEHKAKSFDMKYLPNVNLLPVKYFLPMVGGFIDGMYKVNKVSLKMVKILNDENQQEEKVLIHLDLDSSFIKFGTEQVLVYKDKLGSGQLHTLNKIVDIYFD